ncbi:MAG: VirB8/TrbF family protein [Burkholderiales bacterium]
MENPIEIQLRRNLRPRLEANRLTVLLLGSFAVNIAVGIALAALMPLKERIPYFVTADKDTGLVQVSTLAAKQFSPNEQNIKYFAAKFVRELLTIDPYRTRNEFLPSAKTVVLSKAKTQVENFLTVDNTLERMDKDPSLARNVTLQRITILPSAENVITAIVKLTTISGNRIATTVTKAITLHYVLEPVKSDEEALRNPIGFYVTQFTIDEEMGQ